VRRALSALVPQAAKDALDRRITARHVAAVAGPTGAYVAAHGTHVVHGPFAGMDYTPAVRWGTGDLVSKLTGTYELELRPAFERWVAQAPGVVIDVGSAEGYYAVGLARALPRAKVYAFDIDAVARERCTALAAANGVADRVEVLGECTPDELGEMPATGVALLADCEGYERVLLDPRRAPKLVGWDIVVELHEFADAAIADDLVARFEATHAIEICGQRPRTGDEAPELVMLSAAERRIVLDEHRPARMRWAVMRPRPAS